MGVFLTQGLNSVSCTAGRFFTIWATREALDTGLHRMSMKWRPQGARGMETNVLFPEARQSLSIPDIPWRRVKYALSIPDSVTLCGPSIVAHHAPLSTGFSRQVYWSCLPFCPPGNLPNPGIDHASLSSPALQADSLPLAPPRKPPCYQNMWNVYESWRAFLYKESLHRLHNTERYKQHFVTTMQWNSLTFDKEHKAPSAWEIRALKSIQYVPGWKEIHKTKLHNF